jgi:hypothetical protein
MEIPSEQWKYRIASYRSIRGEAGSWEPVDELKANTWFLFGEKGGDERVFGLFGSRFGAEDAAGKLMRGDMGEEYKGVLDTPGGKGVENDYQQALDQAAALAPTIDNDPERGR